MFEEYRNRFKDIFPTEEYGSASSEEIEEMIQECLRQNKKASELYPVDYNNYY